MRRALAAVLALLLALPLAPYARVEAAACVGVATKDIETECGLRLPPGVRTVTWANPSTPVGAAFEGDRLAFAGTPPSTRARAIDFVTVWQVDAGAWRGWSIGGAPSAEPLRTLEPGSTYAVVSSGDLVWSLAPLRAPSLLAHARVVGFYGRPDVPQMGILGRYPSAVAATQGVAAQAAAYATKDRRVIPALHLIVDAAQEDPGADGTYLGRLPLSTIQPYVDATRDAGQLLFLDLQIGWSDLLTEVKRLEPLLKEPHVHLALDPEFATLGKNEAPGQAIGYLTATQLNEVQRYLADLVHASNLPAKLFVVHQFRTDMLRDTAAIAQVEDVDLVIDMDGYGEPWLKIAGYDAYARAPYSEYPAFKLFYGWDTPLMTPAEVLALPHPPDYIVYQ